jgi:apolipoprotein N-acyltransferase
MHVEIAQGRWLRSTTRTVGIGGLWLVYAALFTWMAFHHHERSATGEVVSPVITVMVLFLALPGYILGIRELRCGLRIDHGVVIVRGMFRTLRLAPEEIEGFSRECG